MKYLSEFNTALPGLKIIERAPIFDDRGLFTRIWSDDELRDFGYDQPISQVNYSITKAVGAVRGLHFQRPPFAETKFITCLRGEVFDVAVDVRKDSPTFLKWHAEILSPKKNRSLLIPTGFAHGFQALSADVELLYLHSAPYSKNHEAGLLVDDPTLAITWPLAISERSQRDQKHALIEKNWKGLDL